jgi:hypothetical protein
MLIFVPTGFVSVDPDIRITWQSVGKRINLSVFRTDAAKNSAVKEVRLLVSGGTLSHA